MHKVTRSPDFPQALDRLAQIATSEDSAERLLAIAILCKIAKLVKGQRSKIGKHLSIALKTRLPSSAILNNSDYRYYLASFWRLTRPFWADEYLAEEAVNEESAENFRRECIDGLLTFHPDLASALAVFAAPIGKLSFHTEVPSDSMARRIRRILAGVRIAFISEEREPGDGAGQAMTKLLRLAFDKSGPPSDEIARIELAEECISLTREVIRTRLSLSIAADSYESLTPIKNWFPAVDWEHFVQRDVAKRLSREIEGALELLVQSGKADKQLLQFLTVISGGPDGTQEHVQKILDRNPGLSEELTAWLIGRLPRRKSGLASESQVLQVDDALSGLLLEQKSVSGLCQQVEEELLPQLKLFSSVRSDVLETLARRIRAMLGVIQTIAHNRGLTIEGNVDNLVDFDPLQHQFIDAVNIGTRAVRIARPAVITTMPDGTHRVIRKALVEPA